MTAPAGATRAGASGATAGAAKGPVIDVAVGVVIRDGSVLLGQRVAGKPYAGWWEFPGGKVEKGETIAHALARELHEELGLDVRASHPWVVREFSYPHASVRLHFRRVFEFGGEPVAREGQAFAWARYRGRIDQAPLLPATVPAIGWLRLPAVCIDRVGDDAQLPELARALRAFGREDAPIVLIDAQAAGERAFETLFYRTRSLALEHGARLLVGAEYPASFARCADGVVLAPSTLRGTTARPDAAFVAARCESPSDLALAARIGADFALAPAELASACAHATGIPLFRQLLSSGSGGPHRIRDAGRGDTHGIVVAAACLDGVGARR